MNLKELREMVNLMNDNNITELEIEREGVKIKLKKGHDEASVQMIPIQQPPAYQVAPVNQFVSSGADVSQSAPDVNSNCVELKAPMVGTFYRAPSPDSPPYIEVGQVVEEGQVVCILEAMKLMNEIKAEVRGKIVEIPIENAQPIEFGQTLFLIEPL
ncbi:MAG: acetyl-CoA carboxylase biotin carboxyl carrier protein [Candidatus Omnitrophica bacterium]|nr:acetyl-CoA carboxylase biotin carboxyl carrier protein [Candidatus Omnitrophota bacterium]